MSQAIASSRPSYRLPLAIAAAMVALAGLGVFISTPPAPAPELPAPVFSAHLNYDFFADRPQLFADGAPAMYTGDVARKLAATYGAVWEEEGHQAPIGALRAVKFITGCHEGETYLDRSDSNGIYRAICSSFTGGNIDVGPNHFRTTRAETAPFLQLEKAF